MPKTPISSDRAWKASIPFPQAVRCGDTLYVCSVGYRPDGSLEGPDITSQTTRTLENIKALVEAAGGTLKDVAKVTLYITDRADVAAMNAVFRQYFAEDPPHRATVVVGLASEALKVEIDAIVQLGR
jgi:2-iminobutanoate/2-iminopropanoate deaminase